MSNRGARTPVPSIVGPHTDTAPIVDLGATSRLSYDSTVPRRLVHRAAVAGALLTDWRQVTEDIFVCAVQWPPGQSLYGARDGRFDSMLIAETIRQAGILVAHVGYGVPESHRFVMRWLRWRCAVDRLDFAGGPFESVATVAVSEVQRRSATVGGFRIDVDLWREGQWFAQGSGSVRCLSPAVYRRVRWADCPRPPDPPPVVPPAPPELVGRELARDVVIGPYEDLGACALRVVLDHPVLFDHPVDHIPGMLLFEAMRQAAIAATGGRLSSVATAQAQFTSFLELDHPCRVLVEPPAPARPPHRTEVRFVQSGREAARGVVELVS
ncbi:ScbA/BarX family gamma-butyrolactone biosynthesis protein [Micromonospora sp. NPDC049559]|uniref:ScbA/BarX family gamma-butyrolactone biosynthesis protein n=1 Tax=Micromonospora sp. NPDC049559 TaxID=3155923 RepID=UPI00343BD094